ncbi:hypothetical protein SESBI_02692 [Sesbania bispinosa]|nr:hypothetical protein SESBI_02692 [Sesbania bispinosa]
MQASQYLTEFLQATETIHSAAQHICTVYRDGAHWKSPPPSTIKCSAYANWSPKSKRRALAVVARDHLGNLLVGQANAVHALLLPLVAKAVKLRPVLNFSLIRCPVSPS